MTIVERSKRIEPSLKKVLKKPRKAVISAQEFYRLRHKLLKSH